MDKRIFFTVPILEASLTFGRINNYFLFFFVFFLRDFSSPFKLDDQSLNLQLYRIYFLSLVIPMPPSFFFLKLQRDSNKIRNKKSISKSMYRIKEERHRSIDQSRDAPSFEEKSATR